MTVRFTLEVESLARITRLLNRLGWVTIIQIEKLEETVN